VLVGAGVSLMSTTVCLFANTISYPEGGGHFWVYLHWALGLRALGCRVIWMERVVVKRGDSDHGVAAEEDGKKARRPPASWPSWRLRHAIKEVAGLKGRLGRYGLAEDLALWSWPGEPLLPEIAEGCLDLDDAAEADLLLNFEYFLPPDVVGRFRRSALVDIDPGLLQMWIQQCDVTLARHHCYFTTGETVGRPGAKIPDAGLRWHYTPPCVALDSWPPHAAGADAPFTTVSHWYADEWVEADGEHYRNDKRSGFMPFLDLPVRTGQPLELALCLGSGDEDEREQLSRHGWRVREASAVAATPWDYQRYVQSSRGEFSCAKPSTVRMQNAWVSDRTLCYLASGKPAVVQHTGPSHLLPDRAGLLRFRTVEEAAHCLEAAAADYPRQCRLARALVEECFDARKVAARVLERALA
jgi:hypothetical protein